MKLSEQWLREWVNPPVTTDELVEQLTMAGLEVDSVEPAAAGLESLLVGEVLSTEKHPDADKLKVCQVSVGEASPLQIVCGAPNVTAGGKYPLAPVGARLPGNLEIKKSKLRGVESHGMLCSASANAATLVSCITPPLEAQYAGIAGIATCALIEDILTIAPSILLVTMV